MSSSKLESLPNEILIECFEYLDGLDILHGFNRLNQRFTQLIRNIRLYIDFQAIPKLSFEQSLNDLISNEDIQQQIYSIKLSNKGTQFQIEPFLNRFSLHQFSNLRSLTFVDIFRNTLLNLLPLPASISCLHIYDSNDLIDTDKVPLTGLQVTTLPTVTHIENNDLLNVRNLTIRVCTVPQYFRMLTTGVQLRYLNINIWHGFNNFMLNDTSLYPKRNPLIHLRELNIKLPNKFGFEFVQNTVERMPNLIALTIHQQDSLSDMFNASNWQKLITTSLPLLKTFQIYFNCCMVSDGSNDLEQFQTDFWQNEHQWFIEYAVSDTMVELYTIPFAFNKYKLPFHTVRYYTDINNSSETFLNVTRLTIEPILTEENLQYHFPCVTWLSLGDFSSRNYKIQRSINRYIESLKMIVNLSNIRHLSVVSKSFNNPKILSQILKQIPELRTFKIHVTLLESLLKDDKCYEYISKSITELKIYEPMSERGQSSGYNWILFCKIFSNLETITCSVTDEGILSLLLTNLSNLLRVNLYLPTRSDHVDRIQNLKEKTQTLGFDISIHMTGLFYRPKALIWILRRPL